MSEREIAIKEVIRFILEQQQYYPNTRTTWDIGIAKHVEYELAKRIAKEFNVNYIDGHGRLIENE